MKHVVLKVIEKSTGEIKTIMRLSGNLAKRQTPETLGFSTRTHKIEVSSDNPLLYMPVSKKGYLSTDRSFHINHLDNNIFKPRIMIVGPLMVQSGIGSYIASLCNSLSTDFEVTLVSSLSSTEELRGIKTVDPNFVTAEMLNNNHFIFYHIGNSPVYLFSFGLVAKYKHGFIVVHEDEFDSIQIPRNFLAEYGQYCKLFAHSRHLCQKLSALPIPYAVEYEDLTREEAIMRVSRRNEYFQKDLITVTSFSDFFPSSLISLKQVREWADTLHGIQFFFIGKHTARGYAEHLIHEYPDIFFRIGELSETELDGYLAASDLHLHLKYPSRGETPTSIVRALWHGTPCAVFPTKAYNEFPVGCMFYFSYTPDVLSQLDTFVGNITIKKRRAAKRFAKEHYGERNILLGYKQLLAKQVKQICIIQPLGLGDLIFMDSVFQGLNELYPGAQIICITLKNFGDILEGYPVKVRELPYLLAEKGQKFGDRLANYETLPIEDYLGDYAFDLVLNYRGSSYKWMFHKCGPEMSYIEIGCAFAGVPVRMPRFFTNGKLSFTVNSTKSRNVVLHIKTGKDDTYNLPIEAAIELIKQNIDFNFYLVGGGEYSTVTLPQNATNLSGKLSLAETKALVLKSDLGIVVDSVVLHLLLACNKPTILLHKMPPIPHQFSLEKTLPYEQRTKKTIKILRIDIRPDNIKKALEEQYDKYVCLDT